MRKRTQKAGITLLLILLISGAYVLVLAGGPPLKGSSESAERKVLNDAKPFDSLSTDQQRAVIACWEKFRNMGNKEMLQLQLVTSKRSIEDESNNSTVVDTSTMFRTQNWTLVQSGEIEMLYTRTFNSILDRGQEQVFLLPPSQEIDSIAPISREQEAIKPEDYLITIVENDSEYILALTNSEHLNFTSITIRLDRVKGDVKWYQMITPNYGQDNIGALEYTVNVSQRTIDHATERKLAKALWINVSASKNLIKPDFSSYSVTDLLNP